MTDRVPTYPGRVTLTPVSGNTYDLTMADEPIEAGTPPKKENLLTDATAAAIAALIGGSTPDTVNEALGGLTSIGTVLVTGSYTGTMTYGSANPKTLTFDVPIKMLIIQTGDNQYHSLLIIQAGASYAWTEYRGGNTVIWSNGNRTVSWYASNADEQMNGGNGGVGYQYTYTAVLGGA